MSRPESKQRSASVGRPRQAESSKSGGPCVFIVEDDAAMRAALERLCSSAGLRAQSYASAEGFWAVATRQSSGCLLLDLALPGANGLELQQRLRKARVTLPIIFLVGDATVAQSVRAMKAGAFDFLLKPHDADGLVSILKRAIKLDSAVRAERWSDSVAKPDIHPTIRRSLKQGPQSK